MTAISHVDFVLILTSLHDDSWTHNWKLGKKIDQMICCSQEHTSLAIQKGKFANVLFVKFITPTPSRSAERTDDHLLSLGGANHGMTISVYKRYQLARINYTGKRALYRYCMVNLSLGLAAELWDLKLWKPCAPLTRSPCPPDLKHERNHKTKMEAQLPSVHILNPIANDNVHQLLSSRRI